MYKIDIKEFRLKNKLTQKQLASYLGIGQGFISQMENGIDPVPEKYIRQILNDPSLDSSMITCDSPAENFQTYGDEEFQRSILKAISAVEKIADSNRILAESNHELTATNKILATSNTDLVEKLAGLLDEIRGMRSESVAKYPSEKDQPGQIISDVDAEYTK